MTVISEKYSNLKSVDDFKPLSKKEIKALKREANSWKWFIKKLESHFLWEKFAGLILLGSFVSLIYSVVILIGLGLEFLQMEQDLVRDADARSLMLSLPFGLLLPAAAVNSYLYDKTGFYSVCFFTLSEKEFQRNLERVEPDSVSYQLYKKLAESLVEQGRGPIRMDLDSIWEADSAIRRYQKPRTFGSEIKKDPDAIMKFFDESEKKEEVPAT